MWELELSIEKMITNNTSAYLVQETCLFYRQLRKRDERLFSHSSQPRQRKKGEEEKREKRGVTSILSPHFRKAHKRIGIPQSITTSKEGKFSKRFIGITLQFPNFDSYGKKPKGNLKFFLSSNYPQSRLVKTTRALTPP